VGVTSNEVRSLIVVFIPLLLTMCRIVERRGDHVRLLYDLLDSTSLTQKIVASSVFRMNEIIVIEEYKLNNTFLHIAFGSQSLLSQQVTKPALIPIEGPEKAT
jgi:hypothetical protein